MKKVILFFSFIALLGGLTFVGIRFCVQPQEVDGKAWIDFICVDDEWHVTMHGGMQIQESGVSAIADLLGRPIPYAKIVERTTFDERVVLFKNIVVRDMEPGWRIIITTTDPGTTAWVHRMRNQDEYWD